MHLHAHMYKIFLVYEHSTRYHPPFGQIRHGRTLIWQISIHISPPNKETSDSVAPEEVIGIFSIAWRCLYAEITKTRLENHKFSLKDAKRRAVCLLHSRLTAYGKLCKDFCSERRYTGRKFLLPKKLSKRTLIKVDRQGAYEIHYNIQQGAILVTQKDSAQTT